jgi:hypothetical protein
MIGAFYDDFLSTVAKGRGMSKEAVRAVAKGRVWSGSQAMEVRREGFLRAEQRRAGATACVGCPGSRAAVLTRAAVPFLPCVLA